MATNWPIMLQLMPKERMTIGKLSYFSVNRWATCKCLHLRWDQIPMMNVSGSQTDLGTHTHIVASKQDE